MKKKPGFLSATSHIGFNKKDASNNSVTDDDDLSLNGNTFIGKTKILDDSHNIVGEAQAPP
jgi:hypothetical protein